MRSHKWRLKVLTTNAFFCLPQLPSHFHSVLLTSLNDPTFQLNGGDCGVLLDFSSYSLHPTQWHSIWIPLFWQPFVSLFPLSWHLTSIRNDVTCPLPILVLNSRPGWISSISQNQHEHYCQEFDSFYSTDFFFSSVAFCYTSLQSPFSGQIERFSTPQTPFQTLIPVKIRL